MMLLRITMFILVVGLIVSLAMGVVDMRRRSYHHGCSTTGYSDGTVVYHCDWGDELVRP